MILSNETSKAKVDYIINDRILLKILDREGKETSLYYRFTDNSGSLKVGDIVSMQICIERNKPI